MFSAFSFFVFLIAILSMGIFLLLIWGRAFVIPRIKLKSETPRIIPEFPPAIQASSNGIAKKLEFFLAIGAIIIYLSVRLIGLECFPIYFFADEAAQTVLAEELVENDFRIGEELFPTYFYNVDKYSLSVSVYLQVLPYLLWGKSIAVTRGVSVLVSLLGAITVGLILKQIFRTQYWWLGILTLSVTPAWFLHSRTAFETVMATAFYAVFLYAYLLYLYRSPKFLYLMVFAGALTFYTYNPTRMVILVSGGLLLFSDFRYHWQNRKVVLLSMLFLGIFAVPYFRFQYYHPFVEWDHLFLLNSYWTHEISFAEKILYFSKEYLKGLSITYWYAPKTQDIPRHVMLGYGHLLWFLLPFMLVGLWQAIRNWQSPAYRVLLIALLSAPVGGALLENNVTRTLSIVVPVSLLTVIGILKAVDLLRFLRERQTFLAIGLFLVFCLGNVVILYDVLENGPTWFDDYGLHGMQYGGKQVFTKVNDFLNESPGVRAGVSYQLSYQWLNGPEMVKKFFIDEPERFFWAVWEIIEEQNITFDVGTLFVVSPDEWKNVLGANTHEFVVLEIIPYPDKSPGFYFVIKK